MDYYSRVNTDLLQLIPPDASVVVEVGCGSGALGSQYLKVNPFCRYVGMEINPEAAARAAGHLSRVLAGNAEELALDEDNVDCLVYGDVLEHMMDPWATVRRHVLQLKAGGQVVACIPNVQHWSVLVSLLRGQWRYQSEGLLDSTHLRFFTLEGIQGLFAQAGLSVFDIKSRNLRQEGIGDFQAALRPVVEKMGIDFQVFSRQTAAFQYIVRAVKGPSPRRLLIQSLLGETKVCARTRILEPNKFLATIPGVQTQSEVDTAHLRGNIPGEDKVFIWQRIHVGETARQQELLRRGYLIVAEMDDDPMRWPEHPRSEFFTFRSCHAVQVSTEALAEFIRPLNPNVAVFPNQLAYLPSPRVYEDGVLTLFFGALNREEDWLAVMPCLNRLLQQVKNRVKVTVIHDRAFFDALETSNKEFTPFCSYEEYVSALRKADIALLPLQPTRFNRMKSDLKFLECAGNGVVALASPTVYEASITDGKTGFIYRTPAEFETKLKLLLEDRALRQNLAGAAYSWVGRNRLLSQHYQQRYAWYRDLIARLPELNEALEERIPGIVSDIK